MERLCFTVLKERGKSDTGLPLVKKRLRNAAASFIQALPAGYLLRRRGSVQTRAKTAEQQDRGRAQFCEQEGRRDFYGFGDRVSIAAGADTV